jgi:D-aspartate ligase
MDRSFTAYEDPSVCGPGAIVIGGDYRALGIVRSLGRHSIPVLVLTDDHVVAAVSRYTTGRMPWPDTDDPQRLGCLFALCDAHYLDGWMLFATDDENTAFISRNHSKLSERFRMTTPRWDILRWAYDKRLTHRLADELGIDRPWTYTAVGREGLAAMPCSFPLILKPAFKQQRNSFTRAKAWRVDDRESLLSAYDAACDLVEPSIIMIQELIPGSGQCQFSYAALCRDGDIVASITARRTRQYPLEFGLASSYVESIESPEVESASRRFLKAIGVTGLAEVEFKRDPRDGRFKLLDVNLRVWGWHTLGRRAGADFPYLTWQLIRGTSLSPVRCSPGVRWLRMTTDLPAAAIEMRRGNLSPLTYLKSLLGPLEYAIFTLDDPLPALLDIPLLAWLACKRRIFAEAFTEQKHVIQPR